MLLTPEFSCPGYPGGARTLVWRVHTFTYKPATTKERKLADIDFARSA
jgi:hypothetical protein